MITIIITCKGRSEHLKQTLQYSQNQITQHNYQILVVDYGDPGNCYEWANKQHKTRSIRITDNVDYFNLSRARNCGAVAADSEILCFVDADSKISNNWLDYVINEISSGAGLVQLGKFKKQCNGICAVTKEIFFQARGYDEKICNWGKEEQDLYARCKELCKVTTYPSDLVDAITHDSSLRVEFYPNKEFDESGRPKSNYDNHLYLNLRNGPVNPNGFGKYE